MFKLLSFLSTGRVTTPVKVFVGAFLPACLGSRAPLHSILYASIVYNFSYSHYPSCSAFVIAHLLFLCHSTWILPSIPNFLPMESAPLSEKRSTHPCLLSLFLGWKHHTHPSKKSEEKLFRLHFARHIVHDTIMCFSHFTRGFLRLLWIMSTWTVKTVLAFSEHCHLY